jgi:hypothetical protein
MTVFSKPIREHNNNSSIIKPNNILSCYEYFSKNINLKKYKLPELKAIVKHYKLVRTGNKDKLIERIEIHFKKNKFATSIQKIFRGWIVRLSFKLRGDAFKNKKLCVNDSDFITLEPLDEIPFKQFYSFKDSSNFIYGFNISSLIRLMKNTGKINNPYNREKMTVNEIQKIITLNNIIQIIFPEYKDNDKTQIIIETPRVIQRNTNEIRNPHIDSPVRNSLSIYYFYPRITDIGIMNAELRTKYNKLLQIRVKPVPVRIIDLFIDIDLLGNYTQSSWFANLDRINYIRFYRILRDIWNFRGQLSRELKSNICPFFNPFTNIFIREIYHVDITHEEIQFASLTLIENLIYTGIDEEHKKLGALHVLSALTVVSSGARDAMPWLYESLAF